MFRLVKVLVCYKFGIYHPFYSLDYKGLKCKQKGCDSRLIKMMIIPSEEKKGKEID